MQSLFVEETFISRKVAPIIIIIIIIIIIRIRYKQKYLLKYMSFSY